MSVDREQIRRWAVEGIKPAYLSWTSLLDLLAELEQAERERDVLRESEAEWQRRGDRAVAAEARLAKADALAEAARELLAFHAHAYYPDRSTDRLLKVESVLSGALDAYQREPVGEAWPVRPGVVANDDPERWG